MAWTRRFSSIQREFAPAASFLLRSFAPAVAGRLLAVVTGAMVMISSGFAAAAEDARHILQLLLNAPQLVQYYHFDQRPDRVPLRVVNLTEVDLGDPELSAAGRPARISRERDNRALEITSLTIGGDAAEIAFSFRVEGVLGNGKFKKSQGRWVIDKLSVAEKAGG